MVHFVLCQISYSFFVNACIIFLRLRTARSSINYKLCKISHGTDWQYLTKKFWSQVKKLHAWIVHNQVTIENSLAIGCISSEVKQGLKISYNQRYSPTKYQKKKMTDRQTLFMYLQYRESMLNGTVVNRKLTKSMNTEW